MLESDRIEKVGHNLKFDLSVLKWQGVSVGGKLFDTMVAHSLIEPEMRHGMDYLSEVYLGYTPVPISKLIGDAKASQINMADVPVAKVAEYSAEDADVTWQLRAALEPLLKEKGQERVFYEVESPLIPVLVDMEFEGIKVDAAALAEFAAQLAKEMDEAEKSGLPAGRDHLQPQFAPAVGPDPVRPAQDRRRAEEDQDRPVLDRRANAGSRWPPTTKSSSACSNTARPPSSSPPTPTPCPRPSRPGPAASTPPTTR